MLFSCSILNLTCRQQVKINCTSQKVHISNSIWKWDTFKKWEVGLYTSIIDPTIHTIIIFRKLHCKSFFCNRKYVEVNE